MKAYVVASKESRALSELLSGAWYETKDVARKDLIQFAPHKRMGVYVIDIPVTRLPTTGAAHE